MPAASLLLAARLPRPSQLEGLSLAVGVELRRTLASAGRIFLKWPNDLLTITKQKIGGVLIEASHDFVIVGVGLNLLMTPQLQTHVGRPLAGLNDILSVPWSRHEIAVRVAQSVQRAVQTFATAGTAPFLADAINAHIVPPGHDFSLTTEDGTRRGMFTGFDDKGALLMRQNGHLHRYWSGEIA